MKTSIFKKGIAFVLMLSMLFTCSSVAFAADNISDDVEIYSAAEMEAFNADYQTKEEATAEAAELNLNAPVSIAPTAYSSLPTTASTGTLVTGNTPYFTGYYTLNAGSAGYVRLTPTQSYYVSAYTTGSTDTYFEVFTDAACTNRLTYNDDSGHGLNGMVYFYANSGQTYYIKLRGYSTSTSGDFFYVLHRGQPTSRSEKGDMFTTYNSSTYQTYNNCYTYALSYYYNPVTGYKFRFNGQNPGEMSGTAITLSDLSNATTAKTKIEAAMTRDFNYFGGKWNEISAADQPQQGYFKVALVLAPGQDYHWYRETPNGTFTHKPSYDPAIATDGLGYLIYQPDTCNRDHTPYYPNYTTFIAYYELQIPTAVSAKSLAMPAKEEIAYPVNNNLTFADITALSSGTAENEAMQVLGQAHGYIGSGMIGSVYELVDGTEVAVYFANGVIDQIRTYNADGSFDILVQ